MAKKKEDIKKNETKKVYYKLDSLKKQVPNFTYAILMGGKEVGKSYEVKKECIKHYMEDVYNNGNAYFRRYLDDISDSAIKEYWRGMVRRPEDGYNAIEDLTKGKYNDIQVHHQEVYLIKKGMVEKKKRVGFDSDEKPIYEIVEVEEVVDKSPTPFCTGFWLSPRGYDRIASRTYPGLYNGIGIVEEFMSQMGNQLDQEPFILQKMVSTIFRGSEKARIYLIGNRINRNNNIYAVKWGLTNVSKQKPGTIETYEFPNYDQILKRDVKTIIAVESIKDNGSGTGLIFNNRDSILGDSYEAKPVTNIFKEDLEKWETIYTLCFDTAAGISYTGKLLVNEEGVMLFYVEPVPEDEEEAKNIEIDRHISSVFNLDPTCTSNFDPDIVAEGIILDLMDRGKLCYSDPITASEFDTVLDNLGHIS